MEIKIAENDVKADVLILPLTEDYEGALYSKLDKETDGLIKRVIETKEFTGKHSELTRLYTKTGKVVLVGLGKAAEVTPERLRRAGGKVFLSPYLKGANVATAALSTGIFDELLKDSRHTAAFYFIEGGLLSRYEFKQYKKPEKEQQSNLKTLIVSGGLGSSGTSLKWLNAVIPAVSFARDLVNTPSSDMTPTILAEQAKTLAGKRVKVKILEADAAKKEGMGSYLSVAKGSVEPPKFIVIEYKGAASAKAAPVAIIGKSITFDSGGISIKPADGMEKMKYDMAGGAAALGIIKAAALLQLPMNLIAILPATENMPSGSATRPGDVVTAITGKTIEILNTDAEGRLVLADAIGYAIKHYKPSAIIDMATLTGACSIALGNEAAAMMGNNDALMDKLKKASAETYERVWQMPLYEEYKDYLKSDVADIKNIGGRTGGLVTAAYFLSEFVTDTPWVHLDIASTAFTDKDKPYICKGATGIGVRLVMDYLINSND
ncbi:MAG: leucyl aminopeptidase [Candidatus Magnetominusculus sp. LBB02]|nr:leucyl aminopeptidase [Candidatus Magnetominusculus sp. LBB02]